MYPLKSFSIIFNWTVPSKLRHKRVKINKNLKNLFPILLATFRFTPCGIDGYKMISIGTNMYL